MKIRPWHVLVGAALIYLVKRKPAGPVVDKATVGAPFHYDPSAPNGGRPPEMIITQDDIDAWKKAHDTVVPTVAIAEPDTGGIGWTDPVLD